MSTATPSFSLSLRIAVLLLSLTAFACSTPPPPPEPETPPKKHAHHAPPPAPPSLENVIEYSADAYLLHLSLAQVALEIDTADISSASADLDIAQAYSLQKQDGNILQPAVILEYSVKGEKGHRRIAVPFSMPHEYPDFPELDEVMYRLNGVSYSLYDVRLAVITLPPPEPLDVADSSNAAAQRIVADRMQPLIKKALPLPPMAQARIDLRLTRFFMAHQSREPAYLVIENAKQSLAAVDESASGESDATRQLSHDIEAQESLLHKTMPFTLDF